MPASPVETTIMQILIFFRLTGIDFSRLIGFSFKQFIKKTKKTLKL
jgi:hypothetical protein